MSNDKMREEFEAAYLKDIAERTSDAVNPEWIEKSANGEYRSFRASGAWWAWQASRELLVIELPEEQPMYMYYAPDVLQAIEAAGVRCK